MRSKKTLARHEENFGSWPLLVQVDLPRKSPLIFLAIEGFEDYPDSKELLKVPSI